MSRRAGLRVISGIIMIVIVVSIIQLCTVSTTTTALSGELTIVPCHAIFSGGGGGGGDIYDKSNWILQTYQEHLIPSFIQHIQLSANSSFTIFSGGMTRNVEISEASSYYAIARKIGVSSGHVEEYARDSMENIIFSICRYKELTGYYPEKIKIIGLESKRERFKMHLDTIRYYSYEYYGTEIPDVIKSDIEDGERWLRERYRGFGCGEFEEKRRARDRFNRMHGIIGYAHTCPEMRSLIMACSEGGWQRLPWE